MQRLKKRTYLLLAVVAAVLWGGCGSGGQREQLDGGSVYSEDSAMARFLTEPDRSLLLLDSAAKVGNLTPERAEYLKAIVLYSAKNEADSCMAMCQRMIDGKVWERMDETEDVVQFQVDLYLLMANAAQATGDVMGVTRYCREGIRLAHGEERLKGSEAEMLGRMGLVLCDLGQCEEGIDTLTRAREMALEDNSWSGVVATLNLNKKLYYAYNQTARYDEAKRLIFSTLARLDRLRGDIDEIAFVPEGLLKDSAALEEFIAFNQGSYYSYLVNIYAKTHQQDSLQYWLDKLEANPQSSDASITSMVIEPLIELGRYDEAQSRIKDLKRLFSNGAISDAYIRLLRHELRISLQRGNTQEVERQIQHIFSLSDSLTMSNTRMMVEHVSTQLELQQETQRREQAEKRFLLSVAALMTLLVLIISLTAYFLIRRLRAGRKALELELDMTHEKLDETQEELDIIKEMRAKEEASQSVPMTPEEIYRRAQEIMETQMPFKDPKFDIFALAALVKTNRLYLSNAINSQSGMNYRSWLAKYRIEYAKSVLQQNPTMTNDQLAEACGFDNRITLYRHFKNVVGMTPNEWSKTNHYDRD